uniref:Brevinin-2PTb n=1 Tax=Pulchrana picturata TaxID=395594 RepID=BR2B_PULPI|nr:RecName: Full=Brevinin-2PTb [Pulchrana picturata]
GFKGAFKNVMFGIAKSAGKSALNALACKIDKSC